MLTGHLEVSAENILGSIKRCFSWEPLWRVFVIPSANVTNSLPKSSFLNWKSLTVIEWCFCRPFSPKCKVNNHHIVSIKDIGEWVPNCPHSHNMFTSLSDKLLDLLGRLPFPCSLRFLHFASRTALIIETWWLFSFRYLSIPYLQGKLAHTRRHSFFLPQHKNFAKLCSDLLEIEDKLDVLLLSMLPKNRYLNSSINWLMIVYLLNLLMKSDPLLY